MNYGNLLRSIIKIITAIRHSTQLFNDALDKLEEISDLKSKPQISLQNIVKKLSNLKNLISLADAYVLELSGSELELDLLNCSLVIFSTLSTAGRKIFKKIIPPNILIIDEASQSVEAETLITFALDPVKCLLVGDTKQLPATTISRIAERSTYDRSMMHRLEQCGMRRDFLDIQYRMEPEIRCWPSKKYYDNRLKDDESIIARQNHLLSKTPILKKPYAFINIEGKEKNIMHSYTNKNEAILCEKLLHYFCYIKHIQPEHIGVISFYAGQVALITGLLHSDKLLSRTRVHTVDSFQGNEKDLIIISCVRANIKGIIGFLRDFRRLNVAITRAKFMLLILGHVNTLCRQKSSEICTLIEDAKSRGRLFNEEDLLAEIVSYQTKHSYKFFRQNALQSSANKRPSKKPPPSANFGKRSFPSVPA